MWLGQSASVLFDAMSRPCLSDKGGVRQMVHQIHHSYRKVAQNIIETLFCSEKSNVLGPVGKPSERLASS